MLNLCPLCGEEASLMMDGYDAKHPNHPLCRVRCGDCGCTSWPSMTNKDAILKWNTRADLPNKESAHD